MPCGSTPLLYSRNPDIDIIHEHYCFDCNNLEGYMIKDKNSILRCLKCQKIGNCEFGDNT